MSRSPWIFTSVSDANVVIVTMTDPKNKMNIITNDFLDQLEDCINRIEREFPTKGIVFTGNDRVFSAGLDLKLLFSLSAPNPKNHPLLQPSGPKNLDAQKPAETPITPAMDAVIAYVDRIDRLGERIFSLRNPTAAAINGHAIAGGTYLACACDYRVGAIGNEYDKQAAASATPAANRRTCTATIGLNEVANGFIIPARFLTVCSYVCGSSRQALQWFCSGKLLTLDRAHAVGVIDELVENLPAEEVLRLAGCGCGGHGQSGAVWVWPRLETTVNKSQLSPLLRRAVELVDHPAKKYVYGRQLSSENALLRYTYISFSHLMSVHPILSPVSPAMPSQSCR